MRKKLLIFIIILALVLIFAFSRTRAVEKRFIDNGDGTITDTQTGLMWAKNSSPGDLTWQDAETYCKTPPIASYKYTDWPMPTIEELKTLYRKDFEGYEADCGLKVRIDPIFEVTCVWIWSSDLPETPSFSKDGKERKVRSVMAYVFDLGRGYKYADRMVKKKSKRALPVRGTMKK